MYSTETSSVGLHSREEIKVHAHYGNTSKSSHNSLIGAGVCNKHDTFNIMFLIVQCSRFKLPGTDPRTAFRPTHAYMYAK